MLKWLHYGLFFIISLIQVSALGQDEDVRIVSGITVIDNRVTHKSIILREFTFQQGDTLVYDQIQPALVHTYSNLLNTGLFNFVEIIPNEVDSTYIEFIVKVTERWYIWPIVIFEFADPNFNTWWQTKDLSRLNYGLGAYHANFRGRKEKLSFVAQLGYSKQFGISYDVPFITRKQNLGMGFSYAYVQQTQIAYGTFNNKRLFLDSEIGKLQQQHLGKLNFTWRNDFYNKHDIEFRFTDITVDDTLLTVSNDYLTNDAHQASYFGMIYSYAHDKRNNVAYPLTGYALGGSIVKYGLGLNMENGLDVLYTILNARGHWQLSNRWYAALSMRGKITAGGDLPYFIQQGFGYSNFVRGYELYVIDGQHYLLGKSNLKYELIRPQKDQVGFIGLDQFSKFHYSLYLNIFSDVGRVWDDLYAKNNTLANETLFGWGLGLDFVTFYDKVLRLEYSFNSIGESGLFMHFVKSF